MTQIKIISNPYKKNIRYEHYNEDDKKFVEIDYKDYPNNKLVSNDYKNTFFSHKASEILKSIYDSFYSKDKKIRIVFQGTTKEYKLLYEESKKYEKNIDVKCIEPKLSDEQEVLYKIKEIVDSINLKVDYDKNNDIYEEINTIINKFYDYSDKLVNDLSSAENELNNSKSEKDKIVNDYIDAINKQKELRKDEISNKKNDKKIFDEFINKYVLAKKTLEIKYDEIKKEVKNKKEEINNKNDENVIKKDNYVEEELNYKEDADVNDKRNNNIFNNAFDLGKKVINPKNIKNVGEAAKNIFKNIGKEIKISNKTDKIFMDFVNENYNISYDNILLDIKENYYNWLIEKEGILRNQIINIISSNISEKEKEIIKKSINDIELSNRNIFDVNDKNKHKLDNIFVKIHLPGVPNVSLIRNEWTNELKKYVKKIYSKFDKIKLEELNKWDANIIDELSNNIIRLKPDIKEKINKINELNLKIRKLQKESENIVDCKSEIENLIDII